MKIAISMIALNESEYIQRAIESTKFADAIYIMDGGSDDGTIELLGMLSKREDLPKIVVSQKPWANDFGLQRQLALDMIPEGFDFWMRLDSDEAYSEIFQQNIIRLLDELGEDIICCTIRQDNLVDSEEFYSASLGGWEAHPRIFKDLWIDGQRMWKWTGQVHEYVQVMTRQGLKYPPVDATMVLNLPVVHYGWLDKSRRIEREELYLGIPGSGVKAIGDLSEREHVVRVLPY